MTSESLLSIREASQILGVTEVTLRQWTDEGKIKAFITPGGHRRYSHAELKRLMSVQLKTHGIKDLVSELQDSVHLHRDISRKVVEGTAWYSKLNEESQERLALLGRHILDSIIKHLTEPSKRSAAVESARAAGAELGEMLAALGFPLTDAVEAFILHRDPIINAATHLMRRGEGFTGRVVDAIPMAAYVMDEALVALVGAHQKHKEIGSKSVGGTA